MTNFNRVQSWLDSFMVRARLRSRNFVLVSSPIPTPISTRLRARRAMTTSACQLFVAAYSGKGFLGGTDNPRAVCKSADVFVRRARAFDERWRGKLLAPFPLESGYLYHHHPISIHTRYSSITPCRWKERESVHCGQALWIHHAGGPGESCTPRRVCR